MQTARLEKSMMPAIRSIARSQAPLPMRLFALCALTLACLSGQAQVVMETQAEAAAPVQAQASVRPQMPAQTAAQGQPFAQAQPATQSQSPTETAVPQLRSRVTDQTGTLTASARDALEQRLAAFEKSKGTQIAVLLVNTTQPDSIEQYATRVFDQWKLGRKNTNDGVLLIVAKEDRTVRIEVGYGLEGAIPDAKASRIINELITPRFKQGDFSGGLDAGVAAIQQLAQGEDLPPPAPADSSLGAGAPAGAIGWIIFVVVVILAGGIMPNVGGAAVLGGIALNYLVGGIVMTVAGAVAAAILSAIFGLLGLRKGFGGRGGPGGGGWGGGFGGGGFGGGGGSSGGGSSGGGFSGGGGSSGGGGASGRW
jgi:uncharacterized protein